MRAYEQIKVLGEGGFGKAILARRRTDRAMFVIKEVRLSALSPKDRREAVQEAKVLASLKHPNIVEYVDSFDERGCFYIVMEYADGGDLAQKIQKKGRSPFTEEEVLYNFIQIALAIKYIHDRKILHRDLKTQNVFLMKDGRVKLGDFGIARVLEHTFQLCRTQIGTPYYLSPEICEGKNYNSKTDVWSLGCILYELCTRKHAFEGGNMKGLLMNIVKGGFTPIPNHYSQNLRDLVASMLTKDPKSRPSVNQILTLPFIKERISSLLDKATLEYEFNHTILHGRKPFAAPTVVISKEQEPEEPPVPEPVIPKKPVENERRVPSAVGPERRKPTPVNRERPRPSPQPVQAYAPNIDPRYARIQGRQQQPAPNVDPRYQQRDRLDEERKRAQEAEEANRRRLEEERRAAYEKQKAQEAEDAERRRKEQEIRRKAEEDRKQEERRLQELQKEERRQKLIEDEERRRKAEIERQREREEQRQAAIERERQRVKRLEEERKIAEEERARKREEYQRQKEEAERMRIEEEERMKLERNERMIKRQKELEERQKMEEEMAAQRREEQARRRREMEQARKEADEAERKRVEDMKAKARAKAEKQRKIREEEQAMLAQREAKRREEQLAQQREREEAEAERLRILEESKEKRREANRKIREFREEQRKLEEEKRKRAIEELKKPDGIFGELQGNNKRVDPVEQKRQQLAVRQQRVAMMMERHSSREELDQNDDTFEKNIQGKEPSWARVEKDDQDSFMKAKNNAPGWAHNEDTQWECPNDNLPSWARPAKRANAQSTDNSEPSWVKGGRPRVQIDVDATIIPPTKPPKPTIRVDVDATIIPQQKSPHTPVRVDVDATIIPPAKPPKPTIRVDVDATIIPQQKSPHTPVRVDVDATIIPPAKPPKPTIRVEVDETIIPQPKSPARVNAEDPCASIQGKEFYENLRKMNEAPQSPVAHREEKREMSDEERHRFWREQHEQMKANRRRAEMLEKGEAYHTPEDEVRNNPKPVSKPKNVEMTDEERHRFWREQRDQMKANRRKAELLSAGGSESDYNEFPVSPTPQPEQPQGKPSESQDDERNRIWREQRDAAKANKKRIQMLENGYEARMAMEDPEELSKPTPKDERISKHEISEEDRKRLWREQRDAAKRNRERAKFLENNSEAKSAIEDPDEVNKPTPKDERISKHEISEEDRKRLWREQRDAAKMYKNRARDLEYNSEAKSAIEDPDELNKPTPKDERISKHEISEEDRKRLWREQRDAAKRNRERAKFLENNSEAKSAIEDPDELNKPTPKDERISKHEISEEDRKRLWREQRDAAKMYKNRARDLEYNSHISESYDYEPPQDERISKHEISEEDRNRLWREQRDAARKYKDRGQVPDNFGNAKPEYIDDRISRHEISEEDRRRLWEEQRAAVNRNKAGHFDIRPESSSSNDSEKPPIHRLLSPRSHNDLPNRAPAWASRAESPRLLYTEEQQEAAAKVNDLQDFASSLREALNIDVKRNHDDDFFEDTRTNPNKIHINDKKLQFPTASDRDSLSYRSEAIRAYLEREIGLEKLIALNQELDMHGNANAETPVINDLPPGIVYLAHQLMFLDAQHQ